MSEPEATEAEAALLGALLVGGDASRPVTTLSSAGLRPEDFYFPSHARAFEAMLALVDRGEAVDVVTASAELRRQGADAEEATRLRGLPGVAGSLANVSAYAGAVREAAGRRRKMRAGRLIAEGAEGGDEELLREGEALLAGDERAAGRPSREQRQDAVMAHIDGQASRAWATPFRELDDLLPGGLRVAQMTVLAGWNSHGKTILATQLLEHARRAGARAALYTNEMGVEELDLRFVARESGVAFDRLLRADLNAGDHRPLVRAVALLGDSYEICPAAGWTADEVARDMRRCAWDVAGLDLLNGLAGGHETKDIDRNVKTLAAACRQSGCHLIACQHLNQARHVGKSYPPEPAVADIRGSGQIADLANNVLFVYRRESVVSDGEPGDEAVLRVAKARSGRLGRISLGFSGSRLRFLPIDRTEAMA